MIEQLEEVLGDRRIVDHNRVYLRQPSGRQYASVLVECKCGKRQRVGVTEWRSKRAGLRCKACTQHALQAGLMRRIMRAEVQGLPPEEAEAQRQRRDAFNQLRWSEDQYARQLCAAHPEGMSLEAIARHYGYSRELMRLIEVKALRRYAALLQGVAA
jgi:hypothetical protein